MANKRRKVKCTWNQEMAFDATYYHTIDAEAELTAMLSKEIIKGYPLKQRKIIEFNSLYK